MDIMEARIVKLELALEKILERLSGLERNVGVIGANYATKDDLAALERNLAVMRSNYATKEDLAAVERDVAVIRSNYATKADLLALEARLEVKLATFETTIIKWFIGTAVTLTGLAFAAAKLIN